LFAKTLVRKDVASSGSNQAAAGKDDATKANKKTNGTAENGEESKEDEKDDEDSFSSKAQIMTLMTTDVDRVSEFSWHLFSLVGMLSFSFLLISLLITFIDSPIEILIGTLFLYKLLGVSAFIGLAFACLFLPMNHYASKVVVFAQDNLMKARDERVALMNEVLGAIRMLKFMAWERSFEKRVLTIREKELKYQRLNYIIEVCFCFLFILRSTCSNLYFHFL